MRAGMSLVCGDECLCTNWVIITPSGFKGRPLGLFNIAWITITPPGSLEDNYHTPWVTITPPGYLVWERGRGSTSVSL